MNYNSFSVLMSVYYKEKAEYLKRAFKSILDDQTVKPNEVVVVKDGPLGESLDKIIKLYEKEYPGIIKVVALDENVGLGEALRIGLLNCSNEIVARMDSDDISLPTRFEKQLKIINEKEVDVVGNWILGIEEDEENIKYLKKFPENHKDICKFAKKRSPTPHASSMFKKSGILEAGGYISFLNFEDYYLWVRLIVSGKIFYNIQEPLYKMRMDDEMFERRGGWSYYKREIKLHYTFYKMGFINFYEFLRNSSIRAIVRLVPNKLRKWFYANFLRDKPDEFVLNNKL